MPSDDAWDWPFLLYTATVILLRSEKQFWRMTPRKLNALSRAHVEVQGGTEESGKPRQGYIDQVM